MHQGKKAGECTHHSTRCSTEEATKEGDGGRKGEWESGAEVRLGDRAGCWSAAFSLNILLQSETFDWLFT